ncbi:MAG: hypothetical protein APR53_05230 [Methanoculleus sp. SDB]|nr:MAG: hypothetical protein APR53_05230 [Methanoculleus sp. SDB]
MEKTVVEFTSHIEFIASIDSTKDCLMNQGPEDRAEGAETELWFNIDVPKGHGLKKGDRIRIIVERA